MLRLDDTITRANLAIVTKGLDEMYAPPGPPRERARRRPTRSPSRASCWRAHTNRPSTAAIDSERKLFELRHGARLGKKSQLKERIAQLNEEIRGYTALQEAKAEEIELIQRELEGVRALWNKNLVQINRLISLEREAARLKGERAQSISAMAQSRGKIGEIELQIIQIDQDLEQRSGAASCAKSRERSASSSSARWQPKTSSSASTSARRRMASCISWRCIPSAESSVPATRSC